MRQGGTKIAQTEWGQINDSLIKIKLDTDVATCC